MNCQHCGTALTEEELTKNAQVTRVHGFDLGLCALCWDAWGIMTFGWQAGAVNRVAFSDRTKAWDARRKTA